MEKTPNGWTIIDRDAGVLAIRYRFTADGTANCFAARMPNGQMLVISPATGLSDEAFDDLAEFGEVGALVANNGFHHLGQAQWRKRFPKARAFAAPEAVARIRKKSKDAGEFEPMTALDELLGGGLEVVAASRTKCGETWASVEFDGGCAWFTSDLIANQPKLPRNFLFRQLFKWTNSAPGFRLFNLAMPFTLKDKKHVLGTMLEDVKRRPPTVIVPSHGDFLVGSDVASRTEALLASAL